VVASAHVEHREEARDDAMALPEEERELLAVALLDSVVPDPEWEEAWATGCECRLEEVRTGRVQSVPWATVEATLRARLAPRPIGQPV